MILLILYLVITIFCFIGLLNHFREFRDITLLDSLLVLFWSLFPLINFAILVLILIVHIDEKYEISDRLNTKLSKVVIEKKD